MKGTLGIILSTLAIALLFASCQEEPRQQNASQQNAQSKEADTARAKAARAKAARAKAARAKAARAKAARSGASIKKMLLALSVRPEKEVGYDRDAFEHWSDLDGNGCDSREDVLRAENLRPQGAVCWDDRGVWFSAYDGERTSDSGSFDVDHVVPLAEAWDSGAGGWNSNKREKYANDLWPLALRAVTASSNRSKSDGDPADWMPPRQSFHCRYVLEWVAVKYRWGLAVDPVERLAILETERDCPRARLGKLPPRI